MSRILTALIVFVATNVDDIILLAAFFADRRLRASAVVVGQFLGMGILIAVSAAVAMAALVVPPGWPALLGAVPLGMGLWQLLALLRGRAEDDDDVEATERRIEGRLQSQVLAVTAVTLANGADNLSVYVPVFSSDAAGVPTYALIFLLLTGAWCVLGRALVRVPAIGPVMQRFGHIILPVVLILIGAQILWGARVLLPGVRGL